MKNKKSVILFSSLLIAILLVAVTGTTLAYKFAYTNEINNQFVPGRVDIDNIENSSNTPSDTNQLTDGTKQVQVKNTGTVESYIRVKLVPSWKYTDGEANTGNLQLSAMPLDIASNTVDLGDIQLNFADNWKTYWIYKNGYFYYKNSVPANQLTSLLLKSVSVKNDKGIKLLEQFQLDVISESIQTSEPINQQPALKSWGSFTLDSNGKIIN